MNEAEAEAYLLDLELFGMRFGLDRMHRLLAVLGLPQRRFASIHVVGSNGKTSTTRMAAALLEAHGVRAGSYTSPHLRSFVERVEIGGTPVSGDELGEAVSAARDAVATVERGLDPDDRVTQFEALTAAAYHLLARRRVEVAVIEAGLGGRHDATNALTSRVQVLTGVSLEHTRWLGDDVAAIAEEKLAVVPDHGHLVLGDVPPEVERVAERVVRDRQAVLVRAADEPSEAPEVLTAPFQRTNFRVACAAVRTFLGRLDPDPAARAAGSVRVPGRLEVVGSDPLEVQDGAHNPAGARALAEALPGVLGGRRLTAVVAVLDDKDAHAVLEPLVPLCEHLVLTSGAHPRFLAPDALAADAAVLDGPDPEVVHDPREALERARALARPDGAVLVTGSLHLIAEVRREPDRPRLSTM